MPRGSTPPDQDRRSAGSPWMARLDGKTLRHRFDTFNDRKAAQVPSAFAVDTALVLAHVEIDGKSNEIPAAQKLLGELDIARHIVTLDALHCQKTFEVAAQAKAQIVVQLKDNQPTLRQKIESLCASGTPVETVTTIDQARSRHETRTVTVFEAASVAADTEWQSHLAAVACVTRELLTRNAKTGLWKSTSETAFYLSNAPATAPRFASAIRGHGGIENKEHYTRDVTMHEDDSRIRCNPGIFARLRSFAYNILRTNQTDTINQDRYRAALGGIDYLLNLTVS